MTSAIDSVRSTQPATSPRPVVAIIAEGDLFDAALVTLVRDLGFDAVLIDLDVEPPSITADQHPVATIVRSARRIPQLRTRTYLRASTVIGLVSATATEHDGMPQPDIRVSAHCSPDELRNVLAPLFGGSAAVSTAPVHVTPRELEVLTTYIMGATMTATAKHHFIAESTVRAHYRRVADRYALAEREVGNKAQMLLALVTDGLISPTELLAKTRTSRPTVAQVRPDARRCG